MGLTDLTPLTPLLEKRGTRRAKQIASAITTFATLYPFYKDAKVRWDERKEDNRFSFKITEEDHLYIPLRKELMNLMRVEDQSSAKVESRITEDDITLALLYDSEEEQHITLEGQKILVSKTEPKKGGRHAEEENDVENTIKTWIRSGSDEQIVLTAESEAGRTAITNLLFKLARTMQDKDYSPPLYLPSRYGSWEERDDVPNRVIDSVILKEGQLDRLLEDFQNFISNEEEYNKYSQSWHRGYIFYGPPGTGKTSIVKALANHFHLPLYYIPLASVKSDLDLISLLNRVQPRSIVLFEDVDIYTAMHEREEQKGSITMSTMLNTLDGVLTPHGLITIMTTNHIEQLDEAVIRKGRIDVTEEFGNLDQYQIDNMVKYLEVEGDYSEYVGQSPVNLMEHLVRIHTSLPLKTIQSPDMSRLDTDSDDEEDEDLNF